jgi:hypothetical protein
MAVAAAKSKIDGLGGLKAAGDPWFKPNLFPGTKRAYEVVASVECAMELYGRKRALRAKDRQTLYNVLTPLVVNLMHHYRGGSPGQGIPVPRSKRDKALGGKANRYQTFSFPRSFPKMLDGLCALGFAEQTIGDAGKFILRKCRKRDIVALPVFDSVVVKSSAENTVREIMRREFKAVTGLAILVKRELPQSGNMKASVAVEIDPSSGL